MNKKQRIRIVYANTNIVDKIKKCLKEDPHFLEVLEEYQESPSIVDDVPLSFDELEVSAKTINEEIILNEKLLDADWEDIMRYAIHEMVHVLQQRAGKVNAESQAEDYLDDDNEIEAFQTQLSYMYDNETEEEIQEYLDNLLDHHDIKGKEREDKKEELLEEID